MCAFAYTMVNMLISLTCPIPTGSPDVAAGTYIVSVISRDHVFDKVGQLPPGPPDFPHHAHTPCRNALCPQLRVDVPPEPESPPDVRPYAVGTPFNPPSNAKLPYPIKLVPRQRKSYFIPHQSFNVLQMFQNPMMLIMVFGGLMMLAMPYVMVSHISVFYSLRFGELTPSMIPRGRKTWTRNYCRKRSRTRHGLRVPFRVVT